MLEHWLWLAHRPGVKERLKYDLLWHFGSAEAVYAAEETEYSQIDGMTSENLEALQDKNLGLYHEALDTCTKEAIQIITIQDREYPQRLKNIYDPPLVLYYKGTLPDFDNLPVIGIVGTRKPSAYGETVARRLGLEIGSCGGLVVSGMALGVDAAAMNGALLANSAVVGVLGCGADIIYPRSNRILFANTEKYGCILSEFLPGTEPLKWNFPKRNRIISGLSCGVVVVEAPEKSGSLITAHHALEQGRDVYAVPGNIDMAGFTGSNRLLRDGAGAISCGWDVLSEYQARFPDKIHKATGKMPEREQTEDPKVAQKRRVPAGKSEQEPVPRKKDVDKRPAAPYIDLKTTLQKLSPEEQAIVASLQDGERLVDDVIAQTGISSGKLLGTLTMLELKRIIVRLPGKRISLRKA